MQGPSNEASNHQLKLDKSEDNVTGMKHVTKFVFDCLTKNVPFQIKIEMEMKF